MPRSPGRRSSPSRRVSKNRPGDPFYSSKAWMQVRDARRAMSPLCVACEAEGRTTPMAVVDHIKPRRDHPELALDIDNTQSLCESCHNAKTAREMAERA